MIYICLLLFLISIGSIRLQIENFFFMFSISNKLLWILFAIIELIMIVLTIYSITKLHWFWSLIISIFGVLLLSNLFAECYRFILSIISIVSSITRYNLSIIDTIITFVAGLILYLIA